jgi:hypothetical protein
MYPQVTDKALLFASRPRRRAAVLLTKGPAAARLIAGRLFRAYL